MEDNIIEKAIDEVLGISTVESNAITLARKRFPEEAPEGKTYSVSSSGNQYLGSWHVGDSKTLSGALELAREDMKADGDYIETEWEEGWKRPRKSAWYGGDTGVLTRVLRSGKGNRRIMITQEQER